jgi:RNA polymerase sigma-70 factor (ECF subfamily)
VDPDALGDDAIAEATLALACADGHREALARFEERYLSGIPAALAHMKLDAAEIDEVRQIVRDRLLVASDGEPARIVGYAGRGTLRGLVKVMAVRAALDGVRRRARDGGDHDLSLLPSPAHDPELAFLKDTYRAAFAEAFAGAVRGLESRERNLLRLHHLGGVTLDELAKMYGMHRATVVRQLAKVRSTLLSETQKGLKRRLRIGAAELESILGLIQSRLDVSVDGLLRSVEASRSRPDT